MTIPSLGDMAQTFVMRQQNTLFQKDLSRLSLELASGQAADVVSHLSGDTSRLARLEHGLSLNRSYSVAVKEAASFTAATQSAFEVIQTGAADLQSTLLSIDNSNLGSVQASASRMAEDELRNVISALNTSVAGRAVFSGSATDSSAMISADDLLAELRMVVAGKDSAADATVALEQWFGAPGAGFASVAYTGSPMSLSPFRLGPEQSIAVDQRADSPEIRDHLMALSMAILSNDGTLSLTQGERGVMLEQAAQRLGTGQEALIDARARLGTTQARIDDSTARLSSERSVLESARTELLAVDPYKAATELENLQFRMETLYAVTVRLSRLSLAEFMK